MSTTKLLTLRDQELVEFAKGSSGGRVSVILEVRRPKLAVPIGRPLLRAGRRRSLRSQEVADQETLRLNMADVALALKQLGLGAQARVAEIAGCYVVEVTSQQLLTLAQRPSIQAIRKNRMHRRMVLNAA